MHNRSKRLRRVTRVIWRRVVFRRLCRLGRSLVDMPNHPVDVKIQERREIDAIRGFYPDYRTPGKRRWY